MINEGRSFDVRKRNARFKEPIIGIHVSEYTIDAIVGVQCNPGILRYVSSLPKIHNCFEFWSMRETRAKSEHPIKVTVLSILTSRIGNIASNNKNVAYFAEPSISESLHEVTSNSRGV